MGLFSKFFGKKEERAEAAPESPVYFADAEEQNMRQAVARAQETFKYFWRELYWENHRIIPALDLAMVKAPFAEHIDGEDVTEHMWLNEIHFDGHLIHGTLVNSPNHLRQIQAGERLALPVSEISDWMFVCEGKTYGGFTVQAMRAQMSDAERRGHDEAWGLDFGSYNNIQVAYGQKEHPENLTEHPMSLNMREKLAQMLAKHPDEAHNADEEGFTRLHRAAIAGNLNEIEVLLAAGADSQAQTRQGDTALDWAKRIGWPHIVARLQL